MNTQNNLPTLQTFNHTSNAHITTYVRNIEHHNANLLKEQEIFRKIIQKLQNDYNGKCAELAASQDLRNNSVQQNYNHQNYRKVYKSEPNFNYTIFYSPFDYFFVFPRSC